MKSNKKHSGFTLIELLVVVAIISLLTSVAMLAYQSARQKSRNTKRLADMTQMANALEIYFSYNKGYPSDTAEMKDAGVIMTIPQAPQPPDGTCITDTDLKGKPVTSYSYYPSGTSYVLNINGTNKTLYPDYYLSFCLGDITGNFNPGVHYVTPKGIR
jgi:prepilin-type N-terminal cleavage/methylation domain-containing protein